MSETANPVDSDKSDLSQPLKQAVADSKPSVKPLLRWLPGITVIGLIVMVASYPSLSLVKNRPTSPKQSFSLHRYTSTPVHPITVADTKAADQAVGTLFPLTLAVNDNKPSTQTPDSPTQQSTHDPQIPPLEKPWAQITTLIENQKQRFEKQWDAIHEQVAALQQQTTGVMKDIQALKRQRSMQPESQPLAKRKVLLKRNSTEQQIMLSSRLKALTPALQLVSIDQWGDQTFAVVRYQGQLHTLRPGSSLLNWTFEHIIESGDGVFVVNSKGQRTLLTLTNRN
jgi:hypothetical protein